MDPIQVANLKIQLKKRGYKAPKKSKHGELVSTLHTLLEEEYIYIMTQGANHESAFQEWKQEANLTKSVHY